MGDQWQRGMVTVGAAGATAGTAVAAAALSVLLMLGWRRGAGLPELQSWVAGLRHLTDRYGARSVPSNLISAVEPPSEMQPSSQRPAPPAASAPPASEATSQDPLPPGKGKAAKEDTGFDKPEPGVVVKKKGKGKKLREHPKNPLYDTLRNVADEVLGDVEDGPDIDKELAKGKQSALAAKPSESKKPEAKKPKEPQTKKPEEPKEAKEAKPKASKPAPAKEPEAKKEASAGAKGKSDEGAADRTSQDDSGSGQPSRSGGDKSTPESAGPGGSSSFTSSRVASTHA